MLLNHIIKKAKEYLPDFNEEKFRATYEFARDAHAGQKRKSGSPYLVHPLETTELLLNFHVDQTTLMAALLHDVPEDTACTISEIEKKFGKEVAFLINGVTKLSKVYYRHKMAERQIESLKKLFLHSAKDIRIILIKLADRLHNMRTLEYVDNPLKRTRIAKETLEIYMPIANLLGIWEIKAELEDLCFAMLYPKEYTLIKKQLKENKGQQEHVLTETIKSVKKNLKKESIEADISGRQKTLYSLFLKIKQKKIRLNDINDLLALKIIVNAPEDCYRVLGVVHQLFKPKTKRFKDYIAMPKPNGYQSLHTTVFGIGGMVTEFQIKTKKMNLEAEYGIAAHYFYKEHKGTQKSLLKVINDRSQWVKQILELQKEQKSHQDFIQDLKVDIFQDRIFVFTPKGEVVDLPRNSTALDFAYQIHTEIGHKANKAEINGLESSLKKGLETGDTIKIITIPKQKGPKREWLDFVITNDARNRIKDFFRQESRKKKIEMGIEVLKKEFVYINRDFKKELTKRRVQVLLKKWGYADREELLMAVGVGILDPKEVLKAIYRDISPSVLLGKKLKKKRGKNEKSGFFVGIEVIQKDTVGALRTIIVHLADMGINILKTTTVSDFDKNIAIYRIYLEVKTFDEVTKIFRDLNELPGIISVKRLGSRRLKSFILMSVFTVIIWLLHPIVIYICAEKFQLTKVLLTTMLYIGFGLLLYLIVMMKRITKRHFPELKRTWFFWAVSLGLTVFALITVLWEATVIGLHLNGIIELGIAMILFAYIVAEFVEYHRDSRFLKKK